MTDAQRQELVRTMEKELIGVDSEIERLKEITRPIAPDNAIGRVTRMDAIGNKQVNEQALDVVRQRKLQLEMALSKKDSVEFGLCTWCQQPIGLERFLAIPEADRCMACAQ